ncbi:MAG: hypothetical protein GC208_00850 [Alphaproteobacteria bacterium]|nr:hypothetical protein [Alphaproteobacteria bacterium]
MTRLDDPATRAARVLERIKAEGPVSASRLVQALGYPEKTVRCAIDSLRARGEAIWHDPDTGGFWWRDDQPPGKVPHQRWKRRFADH